MRALSSSPSGWSSKAKSMDFFMRASDLVLRLSLDPLRHPYPARAR
jgi:hypothetical protein